MSIGATSWSAAPSSEPVPRRGVAVWCDRAILGHGVVALVGRSPQLGPPVWVGDGLHEPPQDHHLREVAVLVAAWDGPRVWSRLSAWLPQWLAAGVSVVLVARSDGPSGQHFHTGTTHPRVFWCSPLATAQELTAAVAAGLAAAAGASAAQEHASVAQGLGTPPSLSEQEQRVLELVTTGLKVSAVARRLDVSPHTVHTYLRRIRRKLAEAGTPVASPLELYRAAALWRLVEEPAGPTSQSRWVRQALGSAG